MLGSTTAEYQLSADHFKKQTSQGLSVSSKYSLINILDLTKILLNVKKKLDISDPSLKVCFLTQQCKTNGMQAFYQGLKEQPQKQSPVQKGIQRHHSGPVLTGG